MKKVIDFFNITDKAIWQHVVLVAILIPLVLLVLEKIKKWYINAKPLSLLLNGYKNSNFEVLLFLSQLSGANDSHQKNPNQKYIASFPMPLPTDKNNLEYRRYQNIDPVWSETDGRCAADVFNILGRVSIIKDIRIADTIKDWDKHRNPIFTIGFNPKTVDLEKECKKINYEGYNSGYLKIEGHDLKLDSRYPKDAGIIQKTFLNNTTVPVFILAGLGTNGTATSGYFLNENCLELGKLYGNEAFCVLLQTDITKGRNYYEIKGVYPRPNMLRAFLYPIVFYTWNKKNVFPVKVKTT